jgi:UDP-glucuronate 4-epimerase
MTLQAVIAFIEQALGKKAIIDERAPAPADIKETWAVISKAGHLLGWRPGIDLETGFEATIEWHKHHAGWLAGIQL